VYKTLPYYVLGFHGCDRTVAEDILCSGTKHLNKSRNAYDWLGYGIYFWENSPLRAIEYARELKRRPRSSKQHIENEAVIGAVIDLGYCLNLVDSESLQIIKSSYDALCQAMQKTGRPIPENKKPRGSRDYLIRNLDCAVIELTHTITYEKLHKEFDTVRGIFWEGKELYPTAGFLDKNHIQICVRNTDCIKGYFQPRYNSLIRNVQNPAS